ELSSPLRDSMSRAEGRGQKAEPQFLLLPSALCLLPYQAARGLRRRSAMVSRRNTRSAFSSFDSPTRTTGEPLRWRRSISNGFPSMYSSSRRGQTYDLRQTAAVLPSCSAVASTARLILRLRSVLLLPFPCMARAIDQRSV